MAIDRRKGFWMLLAFILMVGMLMVPSGLASAKTTTSVHSKSNPHSLQEAFKKASKEFGVPQSILMSVAYNESRWDQHHGQPSTSGGYGIMHLTQVNNVPEIDAKGDGVKRRSVASNPGLHTLDTAAKLLGVDPAVLKKNPAENIRGGAALLAQYAHQTVGKVPSNPADWYGAVAKYSESNYQSVAKDFANQVFKTIQHGAQRITPSGQHVALAANSVKPDKNTAHSLHLNQVKNTNTDCPHGLACRFIPAAYKQFSASPYNYGNYDLANRPKDGLKIRYIIIHDTESSYASAINTFQTQSYVSANYVIRSSDGQITEMVRPENIAWQAGNWYINMHSIGIEHEGVAAEGATWFSEPMYHASARLVKYLAKKYHIPLDRAHILGHDNVPGTSASGQGGMHWDPAAYWNWDHYFDLLGAPIQSHRGKSHNPVKSHSSRPEKGHHGSDIVTIDPDFYKNQTPLTYGDQQLESKPSNFVYLRTAPSFTAPLISDPSLHPDGAPGTTQIYDWGDKAVTGQSFYLAARQGDWTAIYYGGQKVWFYNPHGKKTVPGSGMLITPKKGLDSIPVYGTAWPEQSAYDGTGIPTSAREQLSPLQYQIPAGQVYVATGPFQSDFYYAKLYNQPSTNQVVKGDSEYYQISFNHRIAFVKKNDVNVLRKGK